jgi:hypothetical protein
MSDSLFYVNVATIFVSTVLHVLIMLFLQRGTGGRITQWLALHERVGLWSIGMGVALLILFFLPTPIGFAIGWFVGYGVLTPLFHVLWIWGKRR